MVAGVTRAKSFMLGLYLYRDKDTRHSHKLCASARAALDPDGARQILALRPKDKARRRCVTRGRSAGGISRQHETTLGTSFRPGRPSWAGQVRRDTSDQR